MQVNINEAQETLLFFQPSRVSKLGDLAPEWEIVVSMRH